MNSTNSSGARRKRWPVAALTATALGALSLAGCSDPTETPTATVDAGRDVPSPPPDVPPPPPSVRLSVDSDRNGTVAADGADVAHRAEWSQMFGAAIMANLDDDDMDQMVDAEDEVVNGAADANDLARVRVLPIANLPQGARATLNANEASAQRVRIFKHVGEAWELWIPTESQLTDAELRAGVEFGVESTQFPGGGWNGQLTMTLAVWAMDGSDVGSDSARLRVAPWVMANVLAPPIRVWVADARGYPSVRVWVNDLELSTTTDNVELIKMNALDTNYRRRMEGPDVWVQDIMEFGWSSIPGPDGPHIVHNVIRTPNTTRPAGSYTQRELFGPDFGYIYPHATNIENGGSTHDLSLDSFGNLEMIPPYDHGESHFPLGRILHGTVPTRHSDVALLDLLESQGVQGPVFRVDTSWLLVGHIDELVSFIPAQGTTRGWKLLLASPALARTLLQQLVSRDAANGNLLMFRGENFYDRQPDGTSRPRAAQRTINSMLADADLMAFNQRVQARIVTLREQLQTEIGLTDDEIVEAPFLFMHMERGRAVALMPGTVNLLSYNRTVVFPRPHSIPIDGNDYFETDILNRMTPLGLSTRFAEQWDVLHAADGEVHCGTNVLREVLQPHWWEVAR